MSQGVDSLDTDALIQKLDDAIDELELLINAANKQIEINNGIIADAQGRIDKIENKITGDGMLDADQLLAIGLAAGLKGEVYQESQRNIQRIYAQQRDAAIAENKLLSRNIGNWKALQVKFQSSKERLLSRE